MTQLGPSALDRHPPLTAVLAPDLCRLATYDLRSSRPVGLGNNDWCMGQLMQRSSCLLVLEVSPTLVLRLASP
jgi:hypothetical protein